MYRIALSIIIGLTIFCSCKAQIEIDNLDFLEGTWQIENKTAFEVWKKKSQSFEGYSYKEIDGQKKVTETLLIELEQDKIVYKATVPNQNAGTTIPFVLNKDANDKFSFENITHDFPKKIQYQKINDTRILVSVLGKDDKGFTYYLTKN